ncbi:MAG: deoxyribonuclease IV [bacterium]|nr:deoxyribonuclease IV [bacterium]
MAYLKYKPKIGCHVSIAGGIYNAPERAAVLGCETFQCFTRSPQGGPAPVLTPEIVAKFKSEMKRFSFETFYIHTPYYINFASLNPVVRHSSARIVREELERGSMLGAGYIMTHLGSHAGQTLEEGIARVVKGVGRILSGYKGTTKLLLEISAGAGNVIGDTFDEIGAILKEVKNLPGFGGVCFDTCHAFASGYDFSSPDKAKKMLKEFDEKIGLKWLRLSHVNDSKFALGGHKDRHEHIGAGYIGKDGIAAILTSKPFMGIDWLLETEDEGREKDIEKLKEIRDKQF